MKKELLQRINRLRKALLASCLLNILLGLLTLFFSYTQETSAPLKPFHITSRRLNSKNLPQESSLGEKLLALKNKSFQELVGALKDITLVQDGYRERDFALACLVKFHFFNIEKAFSGIPLPKQKRKIIFWENNKKYEIILFPDIGDEHFNKALGFAEEEKWPMTAIGLFQKLKEEKIQDNSLSYAFQLTEEVQTIKRLFQDVNDKIKGQELVNIITAGKWSDLLDEIHFIKTEEKSLKDLRRVFLLNYIHIGSETAAEIFLKTDMEQAVKKIGDDDAIAILKVLDKRSTHSAKYALSMLVSPRRDEVWMEAAKRLYQFSFEPLPEILKKKEVLARFVPHLLKNKDINLSQAKTPLKESELQSKLFSSNKKEKSVTKSLAPLKEPLKNLKRAYIVQEGDSLWKISRRFNVDIQQIKNLNHLESDFLKPDTLIHLP